MLWQERSIDGFAVRCLLVFCAAVLLLCAVVGLLVLVSAYRVIRDELRVRRLRKQREELLAERRRLIAQLPKGKVLKVGEIQETTTFLMLSGWEIVWPEGKPPHQILQSTGDLLWCGYSMEELREIHARKAEFEP